MSQTATPQAAPPPPPPSAAVAAPAPVPATTAVAQAEPSYVDTPALLNRWQLIGMSVAIVFGLVSALVQFVGWQADGRAAADTEQLLRVQGIKTSLLSADATATNAFLRGGLEDAAQRTKYDEAIESVLKGIATAADAQPADRAALEQLNVKVTDYTTAVAQARDNNRQGFPIGAEYLSGASVALRADGNAIPILDALVKSNQQRAEDAMGGQHPFWLLLLGVVALGVLFWLNRELAQRFRRRINKGIAIAALIVLGVTLVTVVGAWIRDSSNDSLREGEFAKAVAEADARTEGNDAKANESLRLIKRGSGTTYEDNWQASADKVAASGTSSLSDWKAYAATHADIKKLDDDGNWEQARKLALGQSVTDFGKFDEAAKAAATKNGDSAAEDLRSGRSLALILSGLTILLGIAASVFLSRGIGERRREFS
ncbi:hypothetical protein GUY44_28365 [Pimelobacter simplex]|uniref:Secreted protein n=1 Tax=Nocardioides simplex TaxID=2045 RepID=A0A0C5XCS2_NOCSI|nr:hypothetical protein [Pimelobacter simplex]AJR18599.1 secreted protein [Pimelobacter simplex]MCG8154417.1 hypothetical protein [Pimelobacter simplex]GEB16417.1 hypothetical protein NSI01_47320 [Pimelobacter simplex]SFM36799.1 hypothetical protein SAMN05421671_1528 [Pimelobacter simplex]